MTLSHYGQIRLVCNFLPLLSTSHSRRVINVLAGGAKRRSSLQLNDTELQSQYSMATAANHMACLQTLAGTGAFGWPQSAGLFHPRPPRFGGNRDCVQCFCSAYPRDPRYYCAISWFDLSCAFFKMFLTKSEGESGARHVFLATSDDYVSPAAFGGNLKHQGGKAVNGLYLVNARCGAEANWELLRDWMIDGTIDRAWEHTMPVFRAASLDIADAAQHLVDWRLPR